MKVRDFIYMDVERLKSIVAQIEEGLVEHEVRTSGKTEEAGGEIAGSILSVVKGSADVRALWENQQSETRSLHDYLYNKVEEALLDHELVISLPGEVEQEKIWTEPASEWLSPTTFVLAKGRVSINDFRQMRKLMDNFNELGAFLAQSAAGAASEDLTLSKKARAEIERQTKAQLQLEKRVLKGLQLFMDVFYGDRIIIKMVPYEGNSDFRLVGNLVHLFLRDQIESITYKYGTSPVNEWTMLAQVAAVPTAGEHAPIPMLGGSEMETALHQMFESARELERMAQSVVWPEVSVTPIAIYRE